MTSPDTPARKKERGGMNCLKVGDRVEHVSSPHKGTVQSDDGEYVLVQWDDGQDGMLQYDRRYLYSAFQLIKLNAKGGKP